MFKRPMIATDHCASGRRKARFGMRAFEYRIWRTTMKIVIAPDSFKDSLSAQAVADAIASGLAEVWPHAELIKCPMADGGEGTNEALLAACNGELMSASVSGP
ncbi:Glycerate kinase, partial [Pseudomonas syringae pv. coryli]